MKFKIWSLEHRAWWRPDCCGYTTAPNDAGIYTTEEAVKICLQANHHPEDNPNEAMVPIEE